MIGADAQHRAVERLVALTNYPRMECLKALRACNWLIAPATEYLRNPPTLEDRVRALEAKVKTLNTQLEELKSQITP